MSETTRFAPSPSGRLHLGHAHSALFAARKAAGGRFLVRLEDIDRSRCRQEAVKGILEDLAWLGLHWETPIRRQSDHFQQYEMALGRLQEMGLLYPCFCTRRDICEEVARADRAPHGPEGPLYPGTCRHLSPVERSERLSAGEAHAWRLDMREASRRCDRLSWVDLGAGEQQARPELLGDVVLARKDVPTSYHLAVVVDDAAQGVTLVTRGADLFQATHLHRLLQELLQLPVPRWQHHRLVVDAEGRRLAKRHDALSIKTLREAGRTPEEVVAMATAMLQSESYG